MDEFVAPLLLAIIQGLTEWLPISSSGHLVLFQQLFNHSGGLLFDVAIHFGTLMAVFVYFGKDITDILEALLKGNWRSDNGKLGLLLVVSSIPAAILGYVLLPIFESAFQTLTIVTIGFAITGLSLLLASLDFFPERKSIRQLSVKDTLLIGCAQALAIVPGISRSGSTTAAALIIGIKRDAALKFSFLMSIPVIFGANILVVGNNTLSPDLLWATLVAFIVGLATIHLLLKLVLSSKKNLRWFGAYALLLAAVLTLCAVL